MTFNASTKLKNTKTCVFHFIRKKIILTILYIYFSSQVNEVKKKKMQKHMTLTRVFLDFSYFLAENISLLINLMYKISLWINAYYFYQFSHTCMN